MPLANAATASSPSPCALTCCVACLDLTAVVLCREEVHESSFEESRANLWLERAFTSPPTVVAVANDAFAYNDPPELPSDARAALNDAMTVNLRDAYADIMSMWQTSDV